MMKQYRNRTRVRIGLFACVVIAGLFFPFWVFALVAFLYALFFKAYELILCGFVLDAQFGLETDISYYMYTGISGGAVLIAELIKPYLSFYRP